MPDVKYIQVEKNVFDPDTGNEYSLIGRQKCLWVRDHWEPTFLEGLQSRDGRFANPVLGSEGEYELVDPFRNTKTRVIEQVVVV
jgi:hypothetical protein